MGGDWVVAAAAAPRHVASSGPAVTQPAPLGPEPFPFYKTMVLQLPNVLRFVVPFFRRNYCLEKVPASMVYLVSPIVCLSFLFAFYFLACLLLRAYLCLQMCSTF